MFVNMAHNAKELSLKPALPRGLFSNNLFVDIPPFYQELRAVPAKILRVGHFFMCLALAVTLRRIAEYR